MTKADKMFLDMGFKKKECKSFIQYRRIQYRRVYADVCSIEICFNKDTRCISFYHFDGRVYTGFDCDDCDLPTLLAINEKVKECGWDKLTEAGQYNAKKLNELGNPPLKFEELEEDMWVWCKDLYDGCWLRILQTKTDNCGEPLIEAQLTEDCFNPVCGYFNLLIVLSYKEDGFYKKKLKTHWNDKNS